MNLIPGVVFIGPFGLGGSEMLIILFLLLLLFLTPMIFYMLTLQNTLKQVSVENRKMPPEQIWLLLIPLFGTIWHFIVVNRIADSLKYEFIKRNLPTDEDRPGATLGIAFCILNCCCIIPILNYFAGLASLICWIIYWSKINGYKSKLAYTRPSSFNHEIN